MTFRKMQWSLLLAGGLSLLTGCGPEFSADARTEGPFVRVDVHELKSGDKVKVAGRDEVAESSKMRLYFPAEQAGEGTKKLEVEVERDGRSSKKRIELKVPSDALEPYLMVGGCMNPKKDEGNGLSVSVESTAWTNNHKSLFKASSKDKDKGSCKVHEDNTIRMHVTSNTDAKVVIGGEKVKLKDGRGEVSYPMPKLLSEVTLSELMDPGYDNNTLNSRVEAKVSRDGKSETFKLDMSMGRVKVRDAMVDIFKNFRTGEKFPWPRSKNEGDARGLVMFTEWADVQVNGKPRTIRNSAYSKPVVVAADDVKVDQLDLIARAIPADVTRRATCTGYITVTGFGSIRNVGFKMGFDIIVYDHTGKVVAQRAFPKPRRTKCPSSLSGKQGDTVVLVWAPDKKEVTRWLESVRSGKPYVPKPAPGSGGGWMRRL